MIGKMKKASLVLLGALTLPTAMYGEIIPRIVGPVSELQQDGKISGSVEDNWGR